MPDPGYLVVPGVSWRPTDDAPPANRAPAQTQLVATQTSGTVFSSGGRLILPNDYCTDVKCADYSRADFPEDRPHYHVGKRVFAPIEIQFAESRSKR